jgi:hypothetical protein
VGEHLPQPRRNWKRRSWRKSGEPPRNRPCLASPKGEANLAGFEAGETNPREARVGEPPRNRTENPQIKRTRGECPPCFAGSLSLGNRRFRCPLNRVKSVRVRAFGCQIGCQSFGGSSPRFRTKITKPSESFGTLGVFIFRPSRVSRMLHGLGFERGMDASGECCGSRMDQGDVRRSACEVHLFRPSGRESLSDSPDCRT